VKPGYQTTEWWISVVVTLAALLLASGALGPEATATKVASLVVALGAQLGYSAGRAQVNAALPNSLTTLASQNTLIGLAPVQLISARLMIDGAQGGAVTLRTPSGPAIISFMGNSIPTDGTFASRVRVLNSTTQTITVAGSTGVTTAGTMTIADAAYRDFLVQPGSASTVVITNLGGGTT